MLMSRSTRVRRFHSVTANGNSLRLVAVLPAEGQLPELTAVSQLRLLVSKPQNLSSETNVRLPSPLSGHFVGA
jgi:hypothetical protein